MDDHLRASRPLPLSDAAGLTGAAPGAPPLTRLERWVILSVVCVAVAISIALTFMSDDVFRSLLEAVVTALFAGFVISPPFTVAAFGGAMVVAFLTGTSTEMLLALATASGLVIRTAANWLLAVYAAVFLLSVAAAVISAQSSQLTMIVVFLLVATVSGAIGLLLRSTRHREFRLRDQLARRAMAEEEIRRSERRVIADELHDIVSHDLTRIVMQTELMALNQHDRQTQIDSERTIRDTARKALRDLHRLFSAVKDDHVVTSLSLLRLASALTESSNALRDAGYPLESTVTLDIATLPQIIDTTLAHVLRESATNVLKHAGPGPVSIEMRVEDECFVLEVRNEVSKRRPSPTLPSSGYGRIRMAERVDLLGGDLRSGLDRGSWVVLARLPRA